MMRGEDGTVLVALFNGRPTWGNVSRDVEETLWGALEPLLERHVDRRIE